MLEKFILFANLVQLPVHDEFPEQSLSSDYSDYSAVIIFLMGFFFALLIIACFRRENPANERTDLAKAVKNELLADLLAKVVKNKLEKEKQEEQEKTAKETE